MEIGKGVGGHPQTGSPNHFYLILQLCLLSPPGFQCLPAQLKLQLVKMQHFAVMFILRVANAFLTLEEKSAMNIPP